MISELQALDGLASRLIDRARAAGVRLIWRAQTRSASRVVVHEGRAESTAVSSASGHGIQVVSGEGLTALGSRDDFRPEPALATFDRVVAVAADGGRLGLARLELPELSPLRECHLPLHAADFSDIDLAAATTRLVELERELSGEAAGGLLVQVAWRAELDAWRIVRDDGTDVIYAMPRCTLSARLTGSGSGERHGVSTAVFTTDPVLGRDRAALALFRRRARHAARLAAELPGAPTHPPGSFPLVIDYALAKGLAHEAFGHASEADGFRSSLLARDGRFRVGDPVGAAHVSIVDEPIAGDHAWQPVSANGVRRERAVLVDHGRLRDGLSDPWSAGPGGVRLTGAARAESFRNAPQPRMTNIRIEVDDPLPAPGAFEDYGPEQVRDLLDQAGVFRRHSRVTYLSGYSGGQVNAASGDFVFNCKAIYELGPGAIGFHKPAMFTGSMIGALNAVREAFGPLRLDALGYCGKWGQSVPSSGGSHYFLVLDPDPSVKLGGS